MPLKFIDHVDQASWLLEGSAGSVNKDRTIFYGPSGYDAYARVMELPDPEFDRQSESDIDHAVLYESPGHIEILERAIQTLSVGSASDAELFFLLWTGYPYKPELPSTSLFDLHGSREYALARGSCADWVEWADCDDRDHGYPPGFTWPEDRRWCLAFDVDAHFIGVGASPEMIDDLLATEGLVVERANYGAPFKLYG